MDPIRQMYARWAAGDMGEDDQWGDVTAEPRGVDFVEASADGVPAMWLHPHGADPDAVIVAPHGGGFVGGSLYTHRKLYGHLAKAAGVRVLLATYRHTPQFRFPAQPATRERLEKLAGARLDEFDGQLHTFQMGAGHTPAADNAIGRLAAWVRPMLGR